MLLQHCPDPWWLCPEEGENYKFCCFAELKRQRLMLCQCVLLYQFTLNMCVTYSISESHSTQFSFSLAHFECFAGGRPGSFGSFILQSKVLPPSVPLLMTCVRHHEESKPYLWKCVLVKTASCQEPRRLGCLRENSVWEKIGVQLLCVWKEALQIIFSL